MDKRMEIRKILYRWWNGSMNTEQAIDKILALDKTEKEYAPCIHYVVSNGICHVCGDKVEDRTSPAKVPDRVINFTAGYQETILANKINEIIDWAKGVEGRIK